MQNFILRKNRYLWFVILMGCLLFSCEEDDTENDSLVLQNQRVNGWILENMNLYYLWNDAIPQKTNKNQAPADYFKSLLSPEDRFSWIQENFTELLETLSGVSKEAGYDFNLLLLENSSRLIGYITYIKPRSPASRTLLKRGDFFLSINNKPLTLANYASLIDETASPHELEIAVDFPHSSTTENIFLPVEKYEENPILLDTVYSIENRKIAYLVYNFFAADNGDGSIRYEKELNRIFSNFKGVDDLILDLRYNSGGLQSTAVALASMIADCTPENIFAIEQYNSLLDEYLRRTYGDGYNISYFTDHLERRDSQNAVVEEIPVYRLGLNKLYVITSERTASAGELLINALKSYMEVFIIGETTVGKNVGSIMIYEEDPEKQQANKWGILPIVVKLANKDGFSGYEAGFSPDIRGQELDESAIILPLGDIHELLLQKALYQITGNGFRSSSENIRTFQTVASSADRTPARKNLYMDSLMHPPLRLWNPIPSGTFMKHCK